MHVRLNHSSARRLAGLALAVTAAITPLMRADSPAWPTTMPAAVPATAPTTAPAAVAVVAAPVATPALEPVATTPATQPVAVDPDAPTFQTVNDRRPVQPDEVDRALASEWIQCDLLAGKSFQLWGHPVMANEPSTIILGCSSEYQFVLVLSGEVKFHNYKADSGHVIFWPGKAGAKPRVMEYSGRDFQKSMRDSGRADLAEKLDRFTSSQNTRRWWGLVRPMKVNIGAPVRGSVDLARRSYLMQPEAVRVRNNAKDPEDVPRATASAMFDHLRAGQSSEVAQLLSPELFLEPAKRNELARAREGVANTIVSQAWTKQIDEQSFRGTSDPYRYMFSAGEKTYVMTLKPFDQMVYVTSIRPEVRQ